MNNVKETYCVLIFLTLTATDKVQVYVHVPKWCHQREAVIE